MKGFKRPICADFLRLCKAILTRPRSFVRFFRMTPLPKRQKVIYNALIIEISRYPNAEAEVHLFMEVIVLHCRLDFSKPVLGIRQDGRYELFRLFLRGTKCIIQIISTDIEISRSARVTQRFILLARDTRKGCIYHYLLLVHMQGSVALRGTTLVLMIPLGHLGVPDELAPKMGRMVLV